MHVATAHAAHACGYSPEAMAHMTQIVKIGPIALPEKADWIDAEDRSRIKKDCFCTVRCGKRMGWSKWMYTIVGPENYAQEAEKKLLEALGLAQRERNKLNWRGQRSWNTIYF